MHEFLPRVPGDGFLAVLEYLNGQDHIIISHVISQNDFFHVELVSLYLLGWIFLLVTSTFQSSVNFLSPSSLHWWVPSPYCLWSEAYMFCLVPRNEIIAWQLVWPIRVGLISSFLRALVFWKQRLNCTSLFDECSYLLNYIFMGKAEILIIHWTCFLISVLQFPHL